MEARFLQTKACYLWTNILNAPLWAMYGMLCVILYKDLNASPAQIALLFCAKPVVSLLSFYWSSLVRGRSDRLKGNIIWAGILGRLPVLFFPFIESKGFLIFSFALYFLSVRAVIPAWMELLRLNVPNEKRSRVFANAAMAPYLVGLIVPIFLGHWMDIHPGIWRWIFPATALVSLLSLPLQMGLVVPEGVRQFTRLRLATPWKNCWRLLTERRDFSWFQGIYLLGGLGLMVIQPALPAFSVDVLDINYTQLALAICLCKGIGFASTTRVWAPWLHRSSPYLFCALVAALAGLFPLIFWGAGSIFGLFYVAYLLYGVMQAGSEMSWNLSGTLFAKDSDSTDFTGVNVVLVGVRGLMGPALGAWLLAAGGASLPLAVGAALCFGGALWGVAAHRRYRLVDSVPEGPSTLD